MSLFLVCRYLSLVRLFGFLQLFLHLCCSLSGKNAQVKCRQGFCASKSHMFGKTSGRTTYNCWVPPWPIQYFCLLCLTSPPSATAPSPPLSAACGHRSTCETKAALHQQFLNVYLSVVTCVTWAHSPDTFQSLFGASVVIFVPEPRRREINETASKNKTWSNVIIDGWGQLPDLSSSLCQIVEIFFHFPSP